MLSSMTPTIVFRGEIVENNKDAELFVVLGSPGGRTIINTVLGVLVNLIDYQMSIQQAVDSPRVHHQWLPDKIWLEAGFPVNTVRLLEEMGHEVKIREGNQGSVMAILQDTEKHHLEVGCDRRRSGGTAMGR